MVQGAACGSKRALSFWQSPAIAPVPGGLPKYDIAIVLIAACAHATSAAWPFDTVFSAGAPLWWLQTLALAALVGALNRSANARQAGALGLVFATVWLTGTFWWLFGSMHTYGGLHAAHVHGGLGGRRRGGGRLGGGRRGGGGPFGCMHGRERCGRLKT